MDPFWDLPGPLRRPSWTTPSPYILYIQEEASTEGFRRGSGGLQIGVPERVQIQGWDRVGGLEQHQILLRVGPVPELPETIHGMIPHPIPLGGRQEGYHGVRIPSRWPWDPTPDHLLQMGYWTSTWPRLAPFWGTPGSPNGTLDPLTGRQEGLRRPPLMAVSCRPCIYAIPRVFPLMDRYAPHIGHPPWDRLKPVP